MVSKAFALNDKTYTFILKLFYLVYQSTGPRTVDPFRFTVMQHRDILIRDIILLRIRELFHRSCFIAMLEMNVR